MTLEELAKETVTELHALMRWALHAPEQDYSREVRRLELILSLLSLVEAAKNIDTRSVGCSEWCSTSMQPCRCGWEDFKQELDELEQMG